MQIDVVTCFESMCMVGHLELGTKQPRPSIGE